MLIISDQISRWLASASASLTWPVPAQCSITSAATCVWNSHHDNICNRNIVDTNHCKLRVHTVVGGQFAFTPTISSIHQASCTALALYITKWLSDCLIDWLIDMLKLFLYCNAVLAFCICMESDDGQLAMHVKCCCLCGH